MNLLPIIEKEKYVRLSASLPVRALWWRTAILHLLEHDRDQVPETDVHLKRQIMGREMVVAVTNGKLDFGTWKQIFYDEFDGGRRKQVLVKIIGE